VKFKNEENWEDEARSVTAARAQTLAASLWYPSAGTRAAAELLGSGSPNDSPVLARVLAAWPGSGLVFQPERLHQICLQGRV